MDTGYMSTGMAEHREHRLSMATKLDFPLPEEDVDAEWKDI